MSLKDSLIYRMLDHSHRVLRQVSGSQSSIDPVYGDSPGLPNVFYVDSGIGSDSNDGRDPAFPMATIDAANGRCTADLGDVIIVQPGHAEAGAAEITLDVDGVSVIGIGSGVQRPTVTVAAAINGISIDGDNIRVENLYFNESTAAATAMIDVVGANAVIKNCHFDLGATDTLGCITVTATGEVCTIEDNTVIVTADGPDEWILSEGIVDRLTIRRNKVVCSDGTNGFDDAAINCVAVANTNMEVSDNDFSGGGVDGLAIVATALVAPIIKGNTCHGGTSQGVHGEEYIPGMGYRVVKTAARTSGAGADDLFTVTGLVLITLLVGRVTVNMAANSDLILNEKTNSSPLHAITVLDSDAAGTLYTVASDPSVTLNGGDAPVPQLATFEGLSHQFLFYDDVLEATWTEAGTTGTIEWALYYIPLEDAAVVVASA